MRKGKFARAAYYMQQKRNKHNVDDGELENVGNGSMVNSGEKKHSTMRGYGRPINMVENPLRGIVGRNDSEGVMMVGEGIFVEGQAFMKGRT